jgi:hypothetical protein
VVRSIVEVKVRTLADQLEMSSFEATGRVIPQ